MKITSVEKFENVGFIIFTPPLFWFFKVTKHERLIMNNQCSKH